MSGVCRPSRMACLLFWEACSIHPDFQWCCDLRMSGAAPSHPSSPELNCAQQNCSAQPSKVSKASLIPPEFSGRPSNSASNGVFSRCVLSVNPYPWIHSSHMTPGSMWKGRDRLCFGQEPQHWLIPCFPSAPHPILPVSWAHLSAGGVGEREPWGWYSRYRRTSTQAHNHHLCPGNTFC